jgi:hypothetical protein
VNTDIQVTEGVNSFARITVTKTGASSLSHSVNYGVFAASPGTATSGSDYAPFGGTLTFPPGPTSSQTFDITLLDDSVPESVETLYYGLSNATNGAQIGQNGGVGTTGGVSITDTDVPPGATITLDDVSVGGGGYIPTDGYVQFGYLLTATGDIQITTHGGSVSASGPARTSWLTPKTGMSQYQASASVSANCPYASGFYGPWFPLSQPVAWGVYIGEADRSASCTITIYISAIANPSVILDTATLNVNIWSDF